MPANESPSAQLTLTTSPPAEGTEQWLFDEIYLGLQHLARLRLPNTPRTTVELEDTTQGWVLQLQAGGRKWGPTDQAALSKAFRLLGDMTRWPVPGDLLAALETRRAPPPPPPSEVREKIDPQWTPSTQEARALLAKFRAKVEERTRGKP